MAEKPAQALFERPGEKTYRLSLAGWRSHKRGLIRQVALNGLFPIGAAFYIAVLLPPANWSLFAGLLVVLVIVLGLWLWRWGHNDYVIWNTVIIRLGADAVSREQLRIGEIRIEKADATRISKTNGGIVIFTANKWRNLVIPAGLNAADYAEIMAALSQWRPFEPMPGARQLRNIIVNAGVLVGFTVCVVSPSRWIETLAALVVGGILTYGVVTVQRSQAVDPKYRRQYQLLCYGVALFLVARLFVTWGGLSLFFR